MAMAWCRYRRGRAKRRLKGAVLERAGMNGEGLEDFREGYGRCMMVSECREGKSNGSLWLVVGVLRQKSSRRHS